MLLKASFLYSTENGLAAVKFVLRVYAFGRAKIVASTGVLTVMSLNVRSSKVTLPWITFIVPGS